MNSFVLYSNPRCHFSQAVRIVLAEKDITCEIRNCNGTDIPADLIDINPHGTLPTLQDRGELTLQVPIVIMEYLDDRFPHPPLLPVYPVERAKCRQWIQDICYEWSPVVNRLMNKTGTAEESKQFAQILSGSAHKFAEKPYLDSNEFTLADCWMAPILWRLNEMGVEVPKNRQTKPLFEYMVRLFSRESFKVSLSIQEREMAPSL